MSNKEVMDRLVANLANVEHDKLKKKTLDSEEKKRVEKAVSKAKELNLFIYDRGSLTIDHLINLAKKLKKKGELDVIILDYLQLMDSGKRSNSDNSDVSYMTRKLKQLAQELYIPVIALSQLSRASVDKTGKLREPQLTDLRSSGELYMSPVIPFPKTIGVFA